jgi:hypothetical protein
MSLESLSSFVIQAALNALTERMRAAKGAAATSSSVSSSLVSASASVSEIIITRAHFQQAVKQLNEDGLRSSLSFFQGWLVLHKCD